MHVRRTPDPRGTPRSRSRRVLGAAVAATAVVAVLGSTGAVDLDPVRGAAATALGPLERALGPGEDALSRARAEQARLTARLAAAQREAATGQQLGALLADPALAGARLVTGRVVAVGSSGPSGPERVTIDVGSRDGVEPDRTVVATGGLVGRVVSVTAWTADVLVVGSPDLVVGVRVGAAGVLGEAAAAPAPGAPRPQPGLLSLSLVERGSMTRGDAVTTLGSVGGRPFVPGIRVGTVRSADSTSGRLAPVGTLAPAVETTTLDVVAVVLGEERTGPRPIVTGTG